MAGRRVARKGHQDDKKNHTIGFDIMVLMPKGAIDAGFFKQCSMIAHAIQDGNDYT